MCVYVSMYMNRDMNTVTQYVNVITWPNWRRNKRTIEYHVWSGRSDIISYWLDRQCFPCEGYRLSCFARRPTRLCGQPGVLLTWYRVPSPEIRGLGRELEQLPLTSADIKNKWSYTSALPICLLGVERDNFSFIYRVFLKYAANRIRSLIPKGWRRVPILTFWSRNFTFKF